MGGAGRKNLYDRCNNLNKMVNYGIAKVRQAGFN